MIQQRLGETDKDYEARKKRVRRTRQGVDFGLAHAGGGGGGGASGPIPNACITQGANVGFTAYGYDSSVPYGKSTPDTIAATSQFIYANYWMADGTFIVQIGDAGNEQIPDVEFMFTVINGTLLQYVWDKINAYYTASNPTLATQLIADYVQDEVLCYTALPILKKMISYDMNITQSEAVYGPELVASGANVASNYTPYVNNTVEDDATEGAVKITYVDHPWGCRTDLTVASGFMSSDMEIGKTYRIIWNAKTEGGNLETRIKLYEASSLTPLLSTTFNDETIDMNVTKAPGFQYFQEESMGTGKVVYIKSVSVKEIILPAQDTLINNTAYEPHFNAPVIDATQNGPGSILVDGYTEIDTGFSPNLSQYSIEETVTGDLEDLIDGVGQGTFTQRTEARLLTVEDDGL